MADGYYKYKDYIAAIEVDTESGVLFAKAIGLRDTVTAQAETVSDLKREFGESIEDYLEFCAEEGVEPDQTVSGKFAARLGAVKHYRLKRLSAVSKVSINDLLLKAIEAHIDQLEDEHSLSHDIPPAIAALENEKANA